MKTQAVAAQILCTLEAGLCTLEAGCPRCLLTSWDGGSDGRQWRHWACHRWQRLRHSLSNGLSCCIAYGGLCWQREQSPGEPSQYARFGWAAMVHWHSLASSTTSTPLWHAARGMVQHTACNGCGAQLVVAALCLWHSAWYRSVFACSEG